MALIFKVGTLFIKTASKPLANRFQSYVLGHPASRKRVINLAQYLHRAQVYINRGAEGKTGRYFVPDITEDRALELASKFVSESFLFSVGVGVLLLEYRRNERNAAEKKRKKETKRARLDASVERDRQAFRSEVMTLKAVMEAMALRMEALESQVDGDGGGGSGSSNAPHNRTFLGRTS